MFLLLLEKTKEKCQVNKMILKDNMFNLHRLNHKQMRITAVAVCEKAKQGKK